MTNWSEADTKKMGENHILTQFLTLQTSNFTMTQNVLNRVHYVSTNQFWDFLKVNSWCRIINRSHHPWPTYPTERMETNTQQCISEAFCIITSHPNGRLCFWMQRENCIKSFYAASYCTVIGPGLFSATLSLFYLHIHAKVWRGIPYSRTAFSCDVSPVWIFFWLCQLHQNSNSSSSFSRKERT